MPRRALVQPKGFDQGRGIFTADKINTGAVDTNAVLVEFFFGHAAALGKAHSVLVLLGGNTAVGLAIALTVSIFI
jgi:hypothetical protein